MRFYSHAFSYRLAKKIDAEQCTNFSALRNTYLMRVSKNKCNYNFFYRFRKVEVGTQIGFYFTGSWPKTNEDIARSVFQNVENA